MGKKKKGKSQKKYAAVGGDEQAGKKKNGKKQPPRRSKRARRPVENNSIDDYKFRQEVEDGTRTIINIEADGNCLFGSVSDQLYHDNGYMHDEVRHEICDFIEGMKQEFEHFLFVEEDDEDVADFDSYIQNMREGGEWGGNVELVAASRLYRRNIVVFSAEHAFTIEHGQSESGGPDMMLSYHGSEHYNSVRDNAAGKPPPPSRTSFAKPEHSTVTDESPESNTEPILENEDIDKMDLDDNGETTPTSIDKALEKMLEEPPPAKSPKKNDPCPCGSGLRYKKCCLEIAKSKERARKWKAKQQADEVAMEDSPEDEETKERMEGGFRVLKI